MLASTELRLPTHSVAVMGPPVGCEVDKVTEAVQFPLGLAPALRRTQKEMTTPAGANQEADMETVAKVEEKRYA